MLLFVITPRIPGASIAKPMNGKMISDENSAAR
jgi:hypothetical protein